MSKIGIIGAGAVGAQAAFCCLLKGFDVVLVDVVEGVAKGKAVDLQQCAPLFNVDVSVIGSSDFSSLNGCDVVLVTAGFPRKPGMSREDLLLANAKIVKSVVENVVKFCPDCIILIMTNPVDAMSYLALKVSKFSRERVIGQAGVLDSARFRTFVARELRVSVNDVSAVVLGSHGEEMVPVPSLCKINGQPLSELLSGEKIDAIVARTRNAGAEIVSLMGSSAFFAPGASIVDMVDSIVNDSKSVLPCSVFLEGEYSVKNCFMGVPVVLGSSGFEKIEVVELSDDEKLAFSRAVLSISKMQKQVDSFLKNG